MRVSAALLFLLGLAALPVQASIEVNTRSLQLAFSPYGDLTRLTACLPECSDPGARRQEYTSFRGFITANRNSNSLFDLQRRNGDHSVELIFSNPVSEEVRRWRIPHHGYQIGVELTRPQGMVMASGASFERDKENGFTGWIESSRYVTIVDGEVAQSGLEEVPESLEASGNWVGFRNRFWAAMLQAEGLEQAYASPLDGVTNAQWVLTGPRGDSARYAIYAGPVTPEALSEANPDLRQLAYSELWPGLRGLCIALYTVLGWCFGLLGHWGFAIILLALIVQVAMWPLARYAERLGDEAREIESRLAPGLREIKAQAHGPEQAELIIALYEREGVHPLYSLKGMVGLLFLAPVFIAVFNMLAANPWLEGQSLLWIADLSRPDAILRLPFGIPFLGDGVCLLPFIMSGAGFLAGWLHNLQLEDRVSRGRLNRRLAWMSLFIFLLFYTFPSGMVLYWTTVNLFTVVERLSARRRHHVPAAAG